MERENEVVEQGDNEDRGEDCMCCNKNEQLSSQEKYLKSHTFWNRLAILPSWQLGHENITFLRGQFFKSMSLLKSNVILYH